MPIVNYVREHMSFMQYAKNEILTGSERLLWYALMDVFNSRAQGRVWPDEFIPISNDELLSLVPMKFDTFAAARNRLKQRGRIDFIPGEKNKKNPLYKMCYFYAEQIVPDTESDGYEKSYPKNSDNIGGNMGNNLGSNVGGNRGDNQGNIIINPTGKNNNNPKEIDTHTSVIHSINPRARMNQTYIDANGKERPCRFDQAFQTSEKARMSVAQKILNQFNGNFDSEDAHKRICEFLHDGMPPEIFEDEIDKYSSLSDFMAHMAGIFHGRHLEEKRDALEMEKCLRAAKGNWHLAKQYYKASGRFVMDDDE